MVRNQIKIRPHELYLYIRRIRMLENCRSSTTVEFEFVTPLLISSAVSIFCPLVNFMYSSPHPLLDIINPPLPFWLPWYCLLLYQGKGKHIYIAPSL